MVRFSGLPPPGNLPTRFTMLRIMCLAVFWLCAPMAQAHPHVFVDVVLKFLKTQDGRLSGVEVTWTYDDFFSLLVLEDRGLDPDGDMHLSEDERAALMGFDLIDWPDGFEGGLFVYDDKGKVLLGAPEPTHLSLEGGRIVTRHIRRFEPVMPGGLVVRPFDPSYYAALTLSAVYGLPERCSPAIARADTRAADAVVAGLGGASNENLFQEVEVGQYYADTLKVTCAAGF